MRKLVLDLNDRRPAWAMPPRVVDEVRDALPADWEFHAMESEADGSGDGMANLSPELVEEVGDAEIYLGYGVPAALLREGKGLGWVHSGAAGVRGSLTPEMLSSPVFFTNSKGIHGPPMGEMALAMILHFSRGLDFALAAQGEGRWDKDPFYSGKNPLPEVSYSTVGIFGFGGIGREVAKRCGALGARILAFDRGPEAFEVAGSRFEDGASYGLEPDDRVVGDSPVEHLYGDGGFKTLLEQSDFLVLTAPETPESRGQFDSRALARMKTQAVLINLSRGGLVEEGALVEALREGRLRGAGLDVFEKEPLAEGHPFWSLPNLVLTPHVSAVTSHFWRRQTDLIVENIRRYLAGETLLNLVDKEAGF